MCGLFDLLLPNVFLQRFLCFNCCHIFFASNGKSSKDYYSLVELGHGSNDSGTQLFEKAPDSMTRYCSSFGYCTVGRTGISHT